MASVLEKLKLENLIPVSVDFRLVRKPFKLNDSDKDENHVFVLIKFNENDTDKFYVVDKAAEVICMPYSEAILKNDYYFDENEVKTLFYLEKEKNRLENKKNELNNSDNNPFVFFRRNDKQKLEEAEKAIKKIGDKIDTLKTRKNELKNLESNLNKLKDDLLDFLTDLVSSVEVDEKNINNFNQDSVQLETQENEDTEIKKLKNEIKSILGYFETEISQGRNGNGCFQIEYFPNWKQSLLSKLESDEYDDILDDIKNLFDTTGRNEFENNLKSIAFILLNLKNLQNTNNNQNK